MSEEHKISFFNKKYIPPIIALVLLAVICLLLPSTAFSYIDKWNKFDESLGHGYLIFAIVIFELFNTSAKCTHQTKSNHFLIIMLILFTLAHEISSFWGILIFQQFSFYFIWLTAIYYIFGLKYLRAISFPLIFFLFAIPFWEFFNTFFVDLTTYAVTFFFSFSDLTIYIHDNYIETPFGTIVVAEGCSGIRYFQIGFALAVYAALQEALPRRYKLLIILTGIVLGIITNWIRVIGLIYIGYSSEMKSSLMREHDNYGMFLFLIVISGVVFLANHLRKKHGYTSNVETKEKNTDNGINLSYTVNMVKFILIISSVFLTKNILLQQLKTPSSVDNLVIKSKDVFPLLSSYGRFNEEQLGITHQGKACKLVIRTYDFTTPGENIIPYNELINKNYSIISKRSKIELDYLHQPIIVNKLDLITIKNRKNLTLYYWFEYSDSQTANKYLAKLFEISYLLGSEEKMKLKLIWCQSPN
jgi:exosortase